MFRQSYMEWWYLCDQLIWLGITYNATLDNYTWLDNSPLTLPLLPRIDIPSNFITTLHKSDFHKATEGYVLCQKRLCNLIITFEKVIFENKYRILLF